MFHGNRRQKGPAKRATLLGGGGVEIASHTTLVEDLTRGARKTVSKRDQAVRLRSIAVVVSLELSVIQTTAQRACIVADVQDRSHSLPREELGAIPCLIRCKRLRDRTFISEIGCAGLTALAPLEERRAEKERRVAD